MLLGVSLIEQTWRNNYFAIGKLKYRMMRAILMFAGE